MRATSSGHQAFGDGSIAALIPKVVASAMEAAGREAEPRRRAGRPSEGIVNGTLRLPASESGLVCVGPLSSERFGQSVESVSGQWVKLGSVLLGVDGDETMVSAAPMPSLGSRRTSAATRRAWSTPG